MAVMHCVDSLQTQEAMFFDLSMSMEALFSKAAEFTKKFLVELKKQDIEKFLSKHPLPSSNPPIDYESAESFEELYQMLRCPKK